MKARDDKRHAELHPFDAWLDETRPAWRAKNQGSVHYYAMRSAWLACEGYTRSHALQNAAPPANSVGVVSRPEIGASRGPEEATAGGSAPSTTPQKTDAEQEIERAYQVLACYGVPRERARNVPNGIDVYATRMSRGAFDYEQAMADHRRLVRELDVLLNGEAGAAPQASLCDIVAQVRTSRSAIRRSAVDELLRPPHVLADKLHYQGELWGIRAIAGCGHGCIELYVEDDGFWHLKATFDRAWLTDLKTAIENAERLAIGLKGEANNRADGGKQT